MSARNTADISRRQFLRGDLGTTRNPVRPPWAASESLFSNLCDRCDDCIYACPERVIRFGSGGFPEMDFSERGCTLCGECVAACGGKALTSDPRRDRPWMLVAQIGNECLANRNVVCRSCGESCDARAIRFRLRAGGAAQPRLDPQACTGCGSCVSVCPARAVRMAALLNGEDRTDRHERSPWE